MRTDPTLLTEWHDAIADECARIGRLDRTERWVRVQLLLAYGYTEAATLAEAAARTLDDAERDAR